MSQQSQPMPSKQFLLIAANLIHRFLIAPSRAEVKQRFRSLQGGQLLPLQTVELEDKSLAQFGLCLDHSEYRGKFNFSAFRDSLETLVGNIAAVLKADKDLSSFSEEGDNGAQIFAITGVTIAGEQANVLVLGTEPDATGDATVLKLMYLDPGQFQAQQQAG